MGEGIECGLTTATRVFKLMGLPSKAFDSDGYCGFQRVLRAVDGYIVEMFIDYVSGCSCNTAGFWSKFVQWNALFGVCRDLSAFHTALLRFFGTCSNDDADHMG